MKNIGFFIISLISLGCSTEDRILKSIDPNAINIRELKGTHTTTQVAASIVTLDGEEITEAGQLKADTEYDIILKGEGADFIRINFGHVFEILKSPVYTGSPSSKFVYRIKTSPDFDDRIYINVVPLHLDGNEFIREHPQAFFLPN
ncbi:MAG TPA: hypothetical protein VIL31_14280 [Cyclobacteriaceae bacterium]|jgi:hypothetical protein